MIFSSLPAERKLTLPKSGRLFLAVIFLTMIPAYALSVSLMFLMGSVFIGILIYNWIAVVWNTRDLVLEVHQMPELFAGRPAQLQMTLASKRRFLKSRHLELQLVAAGVDTDSALVEVLDDPETVTLTLTPNRRGRIEVEGLYLESAYPFGLCHLRLRFPFREQLVVYPALLNAVPQNMHAQKLDVGLIPRNSGDYQYLDKYQPGDDVRLIHWRKSSLTDTPVLRRDLVSSTTLEPRLFVPDPCPQFEYALSAMATWFQRSDQAEGWFILTEEGLQPAVSRLRFLELLATLQPLTDYAAAMSFADEGMRPIYASQIARNRQG